MAIIKSIARVSHSKNGVKAVLEYISRKSEQTYGINCSEDFKLAIKEFGETKKFYEKEEGRQYKHIVQSFKAGEVDSEKALKIGVEFCEKAFLGHEVFIATHTDREHIHNHIVINSVNLENGKKYHESRADLYQMKKINNEICLAHGLEIPEKNREKGKIIAWDKNRYVAIQNGITKEKESDSLNLVKTIIKTAQESKNREEFMKRMEERGYRTAWEEQRKNITFTVDRKILVGNKDKFRLSTLQKTFNHDILNWRMNFLEQESGAEQEHLEELELKRQEILELKLNIKTLQSLLESLKREEIEKETLIQLQRRSIENQAELVKEAQREIIELSKILPSLIEELKKENVKNWKSSSENLKRENQELMNSICKTQNSQELIKDNFREQVAEFGKSSSYLFQDLKGKINRYFIGIFSLNIFCGILFLIGTYFFQYREIREDIGSIKRILIGDEKYWWDRDNKILFMQRNSWKK